MSYLKMSKANEIVEEKPIKEIHVSSKNKNSYQIDDVINSNLGEENKANIVELNSYVVFSKLQLLKTLL